MVKMSKINLQEPQRNRNATASYVNLIRTSTVAALNVYNRNIKTKEYTSTCICYA